MENIKQAALNLLKELIATLGKQLAVWHEQIEAVQRKADS